MKKAKKILFVAFALILVFCLFSCGGDDGGNTGELLCLGSVDGLNVSAGEGAAEHVQAPGIGRYLVLHEDRLAGDQSSAVDLIHGLADDL